MTRRGVAVAVVLLGLVTAIMVSPVATWTAAIVAWVRGAGILGVLVFSGVYVAASLALLPGSALTLGAGFAYGPWIGVLIASPISVVAALLGFWIARGVGRSWVERRTAQDPRFARLQRAVAARGFRLVLLLRLSPLVPFNLLNYGLGLSDIKTRDYVLASFLGMLPGTILYVYVGSLVTNVSALAAGRVPGGPLQSALYWGGLVASVILGIVITRAARTALRNELAAADAVPAVPR